MTTHPEPLSDFDDLRRVAIGYAQDASRNLWSDFNVHDPGVTLLEQTCFTLTQLAYQCALPTRDLMTTARHSFLFREIGMPHPRKVLGTNPVTDADIEAWISSCDGIENVKLTRRAAPDLGQYDITVNSTENDSLVVENNVRTAFERVRPLCTALKSVDVSKRVDVFLKGQIEISGDVVPETVAALVYSTVQRILAGHTDKIDFQTGAKRSDVYDAPERLLNPNRARNAQSLNLASHLSEIRALSGVLEIDALALALVDATKTQPPNSTSLFYHCVLPKRADHMKLVLTVDGSPMQLNPTRIREEFVRISAEQIAQTHHHIMATDWDVMKPGRPRRFSQTHVDSLLPSIYRATGFDTTRANSTLAQYRNAIDTVLSEMNTALSELPNTFHADRDADFSDPVAHRQRLQLLDYLIALQGIEMPRIAHTGVHAYRCTTQAHRFEIEWRLRALEHLPRIQATRGTAPGPDGPGGFLAVLALMCDLELSQKPKRETILQSYGISLICDAPLAQPTENISVTPIRTHDLLDLVPLSIPDAEPFDTDELKELSPFVANDTVSPTVLQKLAKPETFFIVPASGRKWQVVADIDNTLWPITAFSRDAVRKNDPRADAQLCAARLRATWRMLNRKSETLTLIEPILSAEDASDCAFTAHLVLPNWTARCALESFRNYVEMQIHEWAPAHLVIRLHWLNATQTAAFQKAVKDNASPQQLHDFLTRCEQDTT